MPRPRSLQKAIGSDDALTEEAIARGVSAALGLLVDSGQLAAAVTALRSRGLEAFLNMLDWDQFSADMTDALQTPLAGVYLSKAFRAMQDLSEATAFLDFEALEGRAINFATTQAGARVVQVTREVRDQVRGITILGQLGGFTAKEQARLVSQFIPLHSRFQQAVENTFTRTLDASVRDGKTLDVARGLAAAAAEKHAKRLTKTRATAIARTETLTASNTGRFEGWAAEIRAGNYSADSRKEWVAGTNACDVCDPSTGEVVPWDQPFENGVMMPPMHVNCRCTAVILPPSIELRGPTAPTSPEALAEAKRRRAQQRAEGKEPDGPSVPRPHAVHKRPASNPDRPLNAGDVTNAQGQAIASSALAAARGQITMAEHRAYARSVTGTDSTGRQVRDPAPITYDASGGIVLPNTGRTVA